MEEWRSGGERWQWKLSRKKGFRCPELFSSFVVFLNSANLPSSSTLNSRNPNYLLMNAPDEKSDYLLLFRGVDWHSRLSPEEIQTSMTAWMAWFNGLVEQGRCTGGQSLGPEGKVVAGKAGSVSDGPFAESKETVAGYFLLHVRDIEEALAIAKECPALAYGMTVEVRPLLARCAASQRVADQLASAQA